MTAKMDVDIDHVVGESSSAIPCVKRTTEDESHLPKSLSFSCKATTSGHGLHPHTSESSVPESSECKSGTMPLVDRRDSDSKIKNNDNKIKNNDIQPVAHQQDVEAKACIIVPDGLCIIEQKTDGHDNNSVMTTSFFKKNTLFGPYALSASEMGSSGLVLPSSDAAWISYIRSGTQNNIEIVRTDGILFVKTLADISPNDELVEFDNKLPQVKTEPNISVVSDTSSVPASDTSISRETDPSKDAHVLSETPAADSNEIHVDESEVKSPLHPCVMCDQKFILLTQLMNHHVMEHKIGKPQPKRVRKRSQVCTQCELAFTNSRDLKNHMMTHSGEKPHICKECGQSFIQISALKRHAVTHTGEKPHVCTECKKAFSLSSSLVRHMRTHTGHKPYSCPVCGKSFVQSGDLPRHMLVHTGEKNFICPDCGKAFARSAYLTEHMKVHTKEKPHKCMECGQCFGHFNSLEEHKLRKHPEGMTAKHQCPDCGKTFLFGARLRKHIKTHLGIKPYTCEECGKSFSIASYFEEHMMLHINAKQFECKECGNTFSCSNYLKRHLMKKHNTTIQVSSSQE